MKHDTSQNLSRLFLYTECLIAGPGTFFQISWTWYLGVIPAYFNSIALATLRRLSAFRV